MGTQGLSSDLSTVGRDPNTLIKDKERIDDDAAALAELFRELEREVIGKNSASLQQWRDFRDLILTEAKIAAARTTVSSVPAFLTEHLRRRLFKRSKDEMQGESGEAAETPAKGQINPAGCPDCGGSSWWYPEGVDKGVARCKHDKLKGK
jgi:hypothetical protein